eukprot:CAMPEP_0194372564 /NCGR_PEP_ID=MMETSP0174-20130528/20949_1 /TAXON_ID=216777 /ORGANISM="Proboscia alata, Strain PI-D3" /LENGTH=607 /DNA_ID=CAMNT_0039151173 /DNA_START=102 /DNA_END=1922 /DNA_ORIENTATION=-
MIDSTDTELHRAVFHGNAAFVRNLLEDGADVNAQDSSSGDTPAHICARRGHKDCMMLLIEYNEKVNTKNWVGLTAMGEAKMNGQIDMVNLLNENFCFLKNPSLSSKYRENQLRVRGGNEKEINVWVEAWDKKKTATYWYKLGSDGTKEISWRPPKIETIQHIVRRFIPQKIINDDTKKYAKDIAKERQKINELCRDHVYATRLQTTWRIKRDIKAKQQIRIERDSSIIIQRAWKWRYYDDKFRLRQRVARKIQSLQRMRVQHHHYHLFTKERLWWYRAATCFAQTCQRLWRGYKSRVQMRRLYEIHRLPDPDLSSAHEFWLDCQQKAHKPNRMFGVYLEYTLDGCPKTWHDRRNKRDGRFFRDVKFYVHSITRKAQWLKPERWCEKDEMHKIHMKEIKEKGFKLMENDSALRLQSMWRTRRTRKNFQMLLRGRKIGMEAEDTYLQNPTDPKALTNYALAIHVLNNDYEKARPLYYSMMQCMEARGVDNSFVLFSYAIFTAVTHEEDWGVVKNLVFRGKCAARNRMGGINLNVYDLADVGFYRQATINNHSGESWHNYAICRMLVYHDLPSARDCFISALKASPHNNKIILNFNVLIQDQDYMNKPNW